MAGLVACGAVMVVRLVASFTLARLVANYRAPSWARVWAVSALPVGGGIVLITTTQNAPTLPLNLARTCALVALIGLAFALLPGVLAAENPRAFVWLALDGFGLIPTLTVVRGIEMADQSSFIRAPLLYAMALGSIVFGAVWLLGTSSARVWRRVAAPSARAILIAGICWSYLALPLAHHLFQTPAHFKYITTSTNFFAENLALQAVILVVAFLLAFGASRWSRRVTFQVFE